MRQVVLYFFIDPEFSSLITLVITGENKQNLFLYTFRGATLGAGVVGIFQLWKPFNFDSLALAFPLHPDLVLTSEGRLTPDSVEKQNDEGYAKPLDHHPVVSVLEVEASVHKAQPDAHPSHQAHHQKVDDVTHEELVSEQVRQRPRLAHQLVLVAAQLARAQSRGAEPLLQAGHMHPPDGPRTIARWHQPGSDALSFKADPTHRCCGRSSTHSAHTAAGIVVWLHQMVDWRLWRELWVGTPFQILTRAADNDSHGAKFRL